MRRDAAIVDARRASADAYSLWAAHPANLPHIRAQTRSWLASLALDQDTEEDLVLAVNEAASNAIEHAYTAPGPGDLVRVSFWTEVHHLHLEVADHGHWKPAAIDTGHRGRGILIMQQTVGSVFIDHGPEGTLVQLHHPIAC